MASSTTHQRKNSVNVANTPEPSFSIMPPPTIANARRRPMSSRSTSSKFGRAASPQPNAGSGNKFSEALANFSRRARTSSSPSNPKFFASAHEKKSEDSAESSNWSTEADPFALNANGSTSFTTYPTPPVSASTLPAVTMNAQADMPTTTKKPRGSILLAASDAFSFGRGLGVSLTRRRTKDPQENQILRDTSVGKGKISKGSSSGRGKAKWALQPSGSSSSAFALPDVIEISARASTSAGVARRSDEEDEQRERERLREAAAQSIGLGPLMREDTSSRGHSFSSQEDTGGGEDEDEESEMRSEEGYTGDGRSTGDLTMRSMKATTIANLHLHGPSVSGPRSHRSTSITVGVSPPTPNSASYDRGNSNGYFPPNIDNGIQRAPTPPVQLSQVQTQMHIPVFPCTYASLASSAQLSSMIPKHYPPPSLIMFALSRQWRSRAIVLTSPQSLATPILSLGGNKRSSTPPAAFHLHLFKSTAAEERELERLEINERSVVFVAEAEVAGRKSVVKVGGVDVGARRKELNTEEGGRTMWLLQLSDAEETQRWITAVKNAVLMQRAERAGLGAPEHPSGTREPRGDLDVMLSMRAQGFMTVPSQPPSRLPDLEVPPRSFPPRLLAETQGGKDIANGSPPPTVRSRAPEPRPSSPVSTLKGLFGAATRARSPSRVSMQSAQSDEQEADLSDNRSFANRGQTLLNMLRSNGTPSFSSKSPAVSPPNSPLTALTPGSIQSTAPIMSSMDYLLDKPITKNRGLDDWASIDESTHENVQRTTSTGSHQSLQPPPRNHRPWTTNGVSNLDGTGRLHKPTRSSLQPTPTYYNSPSRSSSQNGGVDGTSHSPVSSIGTPTGVFGTPEQRPRKTSMSSSISSFASAFADRDQGLERNNSGTKRRSRIGKLPMMLTPPTGPPPSIPYSQSPSQNKQPSPILERSAHPYTNNGISSRTSLVRVASSNDAAPTAPIMASPSRPSSSSAFSLNSGSTSPSRPQHSLHVNRTFASTAPQSKRTSLPPPPRPAPTFAPPPTPGHDASQSKQPDSAPARRTTFRESLSNHRSLRLALSPPPSEVLPPRPDEPGFRSHRRSSSGGTQLPSLYPSLASHIPSVPRAPPPTGPLPPTPQDLPVVSRHSSLKQRLRMKSSPSPSATRVSFTASELPSSSSLNKRRLSIITPQHREASPVLLGEPITTMQNDPDFLNMSPTEPSPASATLLNDTNFLHMSSPLLPVAPIPIPSPSNQPSPLLEQPEEGSPSTVELISLSPPPRRGARRVSTPGKENDRANGFPNQETSVTSTTPPSDEGKMIMHQESAVALGPAAWIE